MILLYVFVSRPPVVWATPPVRGIDGTRSRRGTLATESGDYVGHLGEHS